MSSPLPSRLLRSAEQAPVPAALAGLLLAALVIECALPATVPLPSVILPPLRAGTGARGDATAAAAMPVPMRPVILASPVFAPRGGLAKGTAAAGPSGFTLAGTALSRTAALAIVRTAGGTQVLRVGQAIEGYRLVQVAAHGAVFAGKDGRHVLRVGTALGGAPQATAPAADESDQ